MNISDLLRGSKGILDKLTENTVFTISIGHVFITFNREYKYSDGSVYHTDLVKTPAYVLMDTVNIQENNQEVGKEITPQTLLDPSEIIINTINTIKVKVIKDPIEELHLCLIGDTEVEGLDSSDERFNYKNIADNTTYDKNLILLNEGEYYNDHFTSEFIYFEIMLGEFTPNGNKPDLSNIFAKIDSMILRGIVVTDAERELFNSKDGIRERLELFMIMLFNGTVISGRVGHCKNAIKFVLSEYLKPWIKRNLFRKEGDDGNVPSIEQFTIALTKGENGVSYAMWKYFMGGSNKTRKCRSGFMQKTKRVRYPSI